MRLYTVNMNIVIQAESSSEAEAILNTVLTNLQEDHVIESFWRGDDA